MDFNELINEIETTLEIAPGTLKKDTPLEDLSQWDSMARLMFIAMVEEKFGLVVEGKDLAKCVSVGDLVDLVGTTTAN
jgi:acyl carrier protein